jgi:hypothetical protein
LHRTLSSDTKCAPAVTKNRSARHEDRTTSARCSNLRNPTGPANRVLPSPFPALLRAPASAQNPTKIGPKSDHLESINNAASISYDFTPFERSDFYLARAVSQPPPQSRSKPVQYKTCTLLVQKGGGGVQVFGNATQTRRFRPRGSRPTVSNRIKPNKTE